MKNRNKMIYTNKENQEARESWESIAQQYNKPEAQVCYDAIKLLEAYIQHSGTYPKAQFLLAR